MRGLWWKLWRETWLPFEVAIVGCTGAALLGHAWMQSLSRGADTPLLLGGPDAVAWGFIGVLCVLLLLAQADAPRALGLDRSASFLHAQPHHWCSLPGAFAVLVAVHLAFAYGAVLLYVHLSDMPTGHPPIVSREGFVDWPLVFWVVAWTVVLGALAGVESGRVGPWVGLALGALVMLEPFRLAHYPQHGLAQRIVLAVAVPAIVLLVSRLDRPAWRRRARYGIVATLALAGVGSLKTRPSAYVTPRQAVAAWPGNSLCGGMAPGTPVRGRKQAGSHSPIRTPGSGTSSPPCRPISLPQGRWWCTPGRRTPAGQHHPFGSSSNQSGRRTKPRIGRWST